MSSLERMLSAMRVPRSFRSCYNCKNRYGCGVVGASQVPMLADAGQQCGFWRPQEQMFLPTEIELAGMKMREDHERKLTDGETVELKGFGDRDGKYVVKRDKQENGKCSLTKKEETGDQG